jgi:hypothetical protein
LKQIRRLAFVEAIGTAAFFESQMGLPPGFGAAGMMTGQKFTDFINK